MWQWYLGMNALKFFGSAFLLKTPFVTSDVLALKTMSVDLMKSEEV